MPAGQPCAKITFVQCVVFQLKPQHPVVILQTLPGIFTPTDALSAAMVMGYKNVHVTGAS